MKCTLKYYERAIEHFQLDEKNNMTEFLDLHCLHFISGSFSSVGEKLLAEGNLSLPLCLYLTEIDEVSEMMTQGSRLVLCAVKELDAHQNL